MKKPVITEPFFKVGDEVEMSDLGLFLWGEYWDRLDIRPCGIVASIGKPGHGEHLLWITIPNERAARPWSRIFWRRVQ